MNILLAGIQGSGKGTQAKLLEERCGITHICSGDIMRQELAENTRLGIEAHRYWGSGNYVPDNIVLQMLRKHLHKAHNSAFDGYPRNAEQANALETAGIRFGHIFVLELPEQIALERCLTRVTCGNCSAIYGKEILPLREGMCDNCGFELSSRVDDTPEKLKKRFRQHNELTPSLLQHYAGKCGVHKIGAKKTVEAVYQEIAGIIHHASH